MKPTLITADWLCRKGACTDTPQLAVFAAEWPDGAPVTQATLRRARELHLDLEWFARAYLRPAAKKALDEATAAAWGAYEEVTAPAQKALDEAVATAFSRAIRTDAAPLTPAEKEEGAG